MSSDHPQVISTWFCSLGSIWCPPEWPWTDPTYWISTVSDETILKSYGRSLFSDTLSNNQRSLLLHGHPPWRGGGAQYSRTSACGWPGTSCGSCTSFSGRWEAKSWLCTERFGVYPRENPGRHPKDWCGSSSSGTCMARMARMWAAAAAGKVYRCSFRGHAGMPGPYIVFCALWAMRTAPSPWLRDLGVWVKNLKNLFKKQGIAPCDARSFGGCLKILTSRHDISNDLADGCLAQKIEGHICSSIGIASGTSGRAFTEIACLHGIDFTGILIGEVWLGFLSSELPSLEFLSALVTLSPQARDVSPLYSEEDTEFLHLVQNFGPYPWDVAEDCLVPHFSLAMFLLLIWLPSSHPLPIAPCSNLRTAEPRFLST